MVKRPTRKEKTLDLIFSNCPESYSEPTTQHPLGLSDHFIVRLEPNKRSVSNLREVITFRPVSETNIQNYKIWLQSMNWSSLLKQNHAETMTETFLTTLWDGFLTHFPEKQKKIKPLDKPWVTGEIKLLICRRDNLFKEGNRAQAKKLRNLVVKRCREARRVYGLHSLEKLLKTQPKKFHNSVKELMGRKPSVSKILNDEGNPLGPDEINIYFAGICRKHPPLENLPPVEENPSEIPIISPEEVELQLRRLDCNKSSFPNEVPVKVIQGCSSELALPLAAIYNQCLVEGNFPSKFKEAYIVPIPKVANPSKASDLRPISKTSTFAKVFEGFLFKWLYSDIEESIDERQYGFRPKHSTVHYLVILLDEMLKHLELPGSFVDLLIADMIKAFDFLAHEIVVAGATEMGARKFLVRMLASFLTGREQRVQLGDQFSEMLLITCGAPQGTRLGPLAFTIAVNKLVKNIKNRLKFADDLSLPILRFVDSSEMVLKSTLDQLTKQTEEAKLSISREKSAVLRINFTKSKPFPVELEADLQVVECVKVLGLSISTDVKWGPHVQKIIRNGVIHLRSFAYLKRFGFSHEVLCTLYKTYLRPVLEYCSEVWHAGLTQDQEAKIERLQKRACKIILSNAYTSYDESLSFLQMETLTERRHNSLMKFGYECLQSEMHRHILPEYEEAIENRPRTRSNLEAGKRKLKQPHVKASTRYLHSFVPYFTQHYNDALKT